MMSLKTFFLFAALIVAVAAQDVDLSAFDSFGVDLTVPVIITTDDFDAQNPLVQSNTVLDSAVPGGERDLAIVAENGPSNGVLVTGVSGNLWSVSTPPQVSGYSLMQYDGVDGQTQLDGPTVNGLNGFDVTLGGAATSLHVIIESDVPTEYTFFFYDANNQLSTSPTLNIPGGDFDDYFITFATLSGSADLTNLGAMEILVEAFDNVDTTMEGFFFSGPASNPSPSIPPVPTPAPEPSPNGFTWYTFDDDDNGRSPCGDEPDRRSYFLSDDNIVYYYFFGFDFTTQEESSSDAATAVLSAAAAVAGVAAAVL
jgi:hypothetical protein|mmetsp:Transcript_8620/g.35923  ORF Transcript_8620/g.35923 Transcript_8620/m.35923 type:complete len:312 (+) Transcript_8620:144-1079(+)|eukprot:CAMPEP_0114603396 /NCGR_PEP_ID=MMETSP0168-20121206/1_1 /TAXON_ID=95228 ORGANISM="Vannella sp., Strain DIVA3 517/6/12" /NCGR_SAMPLE_ID=MMETSP0168 /ASSEMBLY_ACC=CAM_ASM_000044 /LENGTH=311 /DNA_ID=CAMNT_0001814181 /DNA_START=140 /DNA_END=1075 /DNA_ORIENTATION=-